MRPDGVVFLALPLDPHPGFANAVEEFSIEQFIPQPSVEALAIAVLPRAARFDLESTCTHR